MKQALLLSLVVTLSLFLMASRNDHYNERMSSAKTLISERLDACLSGFEILEGALRSGSIKNVRDAFKNARLSYKRAEAFIEYVDSWSVWMHINGAPLPKTDPKSTYLDVIEPKGFQTIDEMIFADDAEVNNELLKVADKLGADLRKAIAHTRSRRFTDRDIIESARRSILRMASLSITGFDTPSSGLSVAETRAELETLTDIINLYRPILIANHKPLSKRLSSHLASTTRHVTKNNTAVDFAELDRAIIIREGLDPLFGDLLDIQIALGVEFADEVSPARTALNPRSRHIFDNNLLDAHYYTGIPRSMDTARLASLGKFLFFDPIMSADADRACASCHDPSKAFTDGLKTSIALGHDDNIDRNAMTIVNAVYADRYFYDMRARKLEEVIEHVVTNHREFNTKLAEVVERLKASPEYSKLFAETFGRNDSYEIQPTDVEHALAGYIASLVSFNTPFDRYLRGEDVAIDASVKRGFNLFMGEAACATCHFPPTFAGTVPPLFNESEGEVLGVPTHPDTTAAKLDPDKGRFGVHVKEVAPFYQFAFKTVTVRNIELTGPYMHNGAYQTLDQVVDFYARGGGGGIGIDIAHQTLPFDALELTPQDRADLMSFMEALTDTTGLTSAPTRLPAHPVYATRKIGGEY